MSTRPDDQSPAEGEERSDFIREIIREDLAAGRHTTVVTRFPPEPNGYLHIGHAKAICVNYDIANDFGGTYHLRFDDTDPTKEDVEYVDAIAHDIKWLGYDWGDKRFFASDYFERLYAFAVELIEKGKAYVCSLSESEMRDYRGTVTEAGRPSPDRERPIAENLDLFKRMRAGEFEDGELTLRAKIDVAAPNMKMRDPPLYRIRHHAHYRAGDAWCIYPMYDFTHCLSDAIEGITHSLCTLEFENNRALYDWVIDNVDAPAQPHQYEYARLNLSYTVMSKRKLLRLVEEGLVSGWDDPRMPTLAGLRRRGVTPEAIRTFCRRVGIAKANSMADVAQLEFAIRDDLNSRAPRVLAVLDPLELVIENYPEGEVEELEAPFWPHDIPQEGSRRLPFSRTLYIERDDFAEEPPKGYHRLAPGREVRLRYGYVIKCERVVKNDAGEVSQLICSYDPQTRGGDTPDGRKIKGTLHWVSAAHAVEAEIRLYDRLFAVENPNAVEEFTTALNADSLTVIAGAKLEPSLGEAQAGERFQFERQGYFCVDSVARAAGRLVFNRTVPLRDSWAKRAQREDGASAAAPAKREAKTTPASAPAEVVLTPEAARLRDELSLADQDAAQLAADADLLAFFRAALAVHDRPQSVANWVSNELARELKDRALSDLPFGGAELGELVAMIDAGEISGAAGKEVFAELVAKGGRPAEIVAARGLTQLSDTDALATVVDEVVAANPDTAARYAAGNTNVIGFFVGQVMKQTQGKANPKLVNELLRKRLG